MSPYERHLAIFLKEPRLGRVKARLGRDIGHAEAWLFYRRLVRRVLPPLARDARWSAVGSRRARRAGARRSPSGRSRRPA